MDNMVHDIHRGVRIKVSFLLVTGLVGKQMVLKLGFVKKAMFCWFYEMEIKSKVFCFNNSFLLILLDLS